MVLNRSNNTPRLYKTHQSLPIPQYRNGLELQTASDAPSISCNPFTAPREDAIKAGLSSACWGCIGCTDAFVPFPFGRSHLRVGWRWLVPACSLVLAQNSQEYLFDSYYVDQRCDGSYAEPSGLCGKEKAPW